MLSSSKNLILLSSHAQMPWSSKAHKIQSSHAPNFSSSKALKLLSSKHIKNKTCIDLGIAHAPSLTSFLLLLLLPIAAKAIVLTEDVQCWRDNKHGTERESALHFLRPAVAETILQMEEKEYY